MSLLIQNGRVVDPVSGTVSILDLYVENGRVLQLEPGGYACPSPGPGADL